MTEDSFLAQLFSRLPAPDAEQVIPPGDDCAALRLGPDALLLIAVDQLVGDRHYCMHGSEAASPEQAGRKLLARNLSDIAAMGGTPRYCLTAIGLSPMQDVTWLEAFFTGLLALANDFSVQLVGGDLTGTPNDSVASLTILGEVAESAVCRRSGTRSGDVLFATGCFGSSLATAHHLSFAPRCAEGRWLAERRIPTAMIDVSDGLLIDARRLCSASGVGLTLDVNAVPRRTPSTTIQQALTDGEDYELLLSVPPQRASTLLGQWPFTRTPLHAIGEFRQECTPDIVDPNGRALGEGSVGGWDHLAGRS